ncbi:MAG TPA: putative selenate reductase subunit YgfK [Dermatophilaceae bacterium]|nr:putative selenate reductase subunit YgfK [Dermatophilaceae bacterium]
MGDIMRPLSFGHLMDWSLSELRTDNSIFGVHADHFWRPQAGRSVTDAFGHRLANPVGPAAGPQTQLSNNLLVAYLTGARFMELKTVQKIDGHELAAMVPKPCIQAEDEGYNCEWSTELTVQQAYDEYVRAFFAIAVLAKELGIGEVTDQAFNMSVGYDLAGIQGDKVQSFLAGMADATTTPVWHECVDWVGAHLGNFSHFTRADLDALNPTLSTSVTLSTMHGCPADEIERIVSYLITEKHLNTFVKCNPTLLGYEAAREIVDRLGFEYLTFDDHHFTADLQYADALGMLARLTSLAADEGLRFGVKLTNTFPVQVKRGELPADEVYMSGRSLLPLTLSVAAKLAHDFDGRLPMSFSGGVDAFNLEALLRTGIQPVTVATTLLKPGGVLRFNQLADTAAAVMTDYHGIDVAAVDALLADVMADPRYHKRYREKIPSRKTASPLPLTDCYKAPCEHGGCPIEQRIPDYLTLTAAGRYAEAFDVIALDNVSPTITGVLCSQQCREHCTRLDYDTSIDMRGVKLVASDHAQDDYLARTTPAPLRTEQRAAVIGAGAAGIAAALYLRRNGMDVEVFERLEAPYGIVSQIIPWFRIGKDHIERDYQLAVAAGVTFHYGADPDYDVAELLTRYQHVVIATGSWGKGMNPFASAEAGADRVVDSLDFLWKANHGEPVEVGRRVAVIGAGDVAMDCVRTAQRLPGVEEAVIVYRRTEPNMPATQHEVNTVRGEGLTMLELLAPVSFDGTTLRCEKTVLAEADAAPGKRARLSVKGTGDFIDMAFDTVIGATGATIDTSRYAAAGLAMDARGRVVLDAAYQSSVPNVYVVGDGRLGPDTIVRAMGDARTAARAILAKAGLTPDYDAPEVRGHVPPPELSHRRGLLIAEINGKAEGGRCLTCDDVCEICTEVCPNRANIAITVPGFVDPRQIIHIDGLCNECGNCGTFCPHAGLPYHDKLTVFWTRQDFDLSADAGFLPLPGGGYLTRTPEGEVFEMNGDRSRISPEAARVLAAIETDHPYLLAPAEGALG